ncbi:MAG TPA: Caa(3)-type oxidase subunit IV [Ramlibacter sp.]|nr:Caa(3)-type oxidase subunit IV [Ramlibacter sp.]
MNEADFRRRRRRIAIAWIALLALMLTSLGSAYLSLGIGNVIAGLVIATIKSSIVVIVFMGLGRSSAMVRIAAAAALSMWFVLAGLSGVDYATRPHEPARYQSPRQLQPLTGKENEP